jgi:galactoside O-acetyltransferase
MVKNSLNEITYNQKLFKSCGKDVYVSGNVEIMRPWLISIGHNVMIDSYLFCTTKAWLGNYIHIGPHCSICGGEKGVLLMDSFSGMSAGCQIICGSDDFANGTGLRNPTVPDKYRCDLTVKPITFEAFVTIGANTTVLPGVTLGIGSCVGADSLVIRDTEPWTLYFGRPAKPIRSIPKDTILRYAKEMGYEYE